jgi:hypothetical protein
MTTSRTLHPTAAAARIAPLLITLAGLAIAAGGLWLWRHRQQIAAALVAAVATTYAAEAWARQQIEALATDSARRLPSQPVAAVAPITATLAAVWGAGGSRHHDPSASGATGPDGGHCQRLRPRARRSAATHKAPLLRCCRERSI